MTHLVEKAEVVAARAYAPCLNYEVGAVVRTDDGREFEGVNVENAAYPLGVCAEERARRRRRGGLRPRADRGDQDHGVSLRRLYVAEFRIPEVGFRREDGTIATYRRRLLLPET